MSTAVPRSGTRRVPWRARLWVPAITAGAVLAAGLSGPLLAPHSPTAQVTAPYAAPGPGHWLGGDHLGRDVLSRLLEGGPSVVLTTLAATAGAVTAGT
ncbi:ABC transporter permease, partial [Streptomyces sp. NPDC055078]